MSLRLLEVLVTAASPHRSADALESFAVEVKKEYQPCARAGDRGAHLDDSNVRNMTNITKTMCRSVSRLPRIVLEIFSTRNGTVVS